MWVVEIPTPYTGPVTKSLIWDGYDFGSIPWSVTCGTPMPAVGFVPPAAQGTPPSTSKLTDRRSIVEGGLIIQPISNRNGLIAQTMTSFTIGKLLFFHGDVRMPAHPTEPRSWRKPKLTFTGLENATIVVAMVVGHRGIIEGPGDGCFVSGTQVRQG